MSGLRQRLRGRRLGQLAPAALLIPAAALVALALLTAPVAAFIRLATDATGITGLYWASQPVPFAIHASGSDDVATDHEAAAIRLAFESWEEVAGSGLRFVELTDPGLTQGQKVAQNDGRNLVFFDESNATGLFTGASFVVAITPVYFDTRSGRILDGDIVLNGRDHAFTVTPGLSGQAGRYDVQNIVTHEVGHFVGFDHSANHGATMVPFATPGEVRLRSLSADEMGGARTVYRDGTLGTGTISGSVRHAATQNGVNGAHVTATDITTGMPAVSTLSASNGSFHLVGLEAGIYHVAIEPLDGPTRDGNIQRNGVDAAFATRFVGTIDSPDQVAVSAGATTPVGICDVDGGTGINIEQVVPRAVPRARSTQVFIQQPAGTPSLRGMQVEITGSGITHDLSVGNGGRVNVTVAGNALPGCRDVILRRGNGATREMVILPGGLEILDDEPRITALVPEVAPAGGGPPVELVGGDFEAGARVIFGGVLVPKADVTFNHTGSLTVSPPALAPQVVDVTLINPDGQEHTLVAGFRYSADPVPNVATPASGPSAGGVELEIAGSQFVPGATVTFGSRAATGVTVEAGGSLIRCTTPPGVPGSTVTVTIRNPDGSTATLPGGYRYIRPQVVDVTPAIGSTSGGTEVALRGDGFSPGMTVRFGSRTSLRVTYNSQFEIIAEAPAGAPGVVGITVIASDGQANVVGNGYEYVFGVEPRIDSVTPATGTFEGGEELTLRGVGFEPGAEVYVGGVAASNVVVHSGDLITAVTPGGGVGAADVIVENPSGLQDVAPAGYTFVVPRQGDDGRSSGFGFGACSTSGDGGPGLAGLLVLLAVLLASWIARQGPRRLQPRRVPVRSRRRP